MVRPYSREMPKMVSFFFTLCCPRMVEVCCADTLLTVKASKVVSKKYLKSRVINSKIFYFAYKSTK